MKLVTFTHADLERALPLENNSFDRVICCLVLEHIKNLEELFSEMKRTEVSMNSMLAPPGEELPNCSAPPPMPFAGSRRLVGSPHALKPAVTSPAAIVFDVPSVTSANVS